MQGLKVDVYGGVKKGSKSCAFRPLFKWILTILKPLSPLDFVPDADLIHDNLMLVVKDVSG